MNKIILKPGDLILYRVNKHSSIHDKLIAIGEWLLHKKGASNNYCHVSMIDTDTDLILEAVWPKTHVIKFDWDKLSEKNTLEVYRVKDLTEEQCKKAISWAHNNLGLWYNLGLLLFGWFPKKHEVICSTYVFKAWSFAGIELGNGNEKLFSPDEIAVSNLVKRVK